MALATETALPEALATVLAMRMGLLMPMGWPQVEYPLAPSSLALVCRERRRSLPVAPA